MLNGRHILFIAAASIYSLLSTASAFASPYEVLVVDIAKADEVDKIRGYKEDAKRFNALHRKGYLTAKPYFDVLKMANGQVYFVFGFRREVQGVHRENYQRTVKNLQRLKKGGAPKYPTMYWVPVDEIRKGMAQPQPGQAGCRGALIPR